MLSHFGYRTPACSQHHKINCGESMSMNLRKQPVPESAAFLRGG